MWIQVPTCGGVLVLHKKVFFFNTFLRDIVRINAHDLGVGVYKTNNGSPGQGIRLHQNFYENLANPHKTAGFVAIRIVLVPLYGAGVALESFYSYKRLTVGNFFFVTKN
jgi:hypothetical protein